LRRVTISRIFTGKGKKGKNRRESTDRKTTQFEQKDIWRKDARGSTSFE